MEGWLEFENQSNRDQIGLMWEYIKAVTILGYILTKMESLPCNDAFETDGMHLLSLLSAICFFLHNNLGTDIGC